VDTGSFGRALSGYLAGVKLREVVTRTSLLRRLFVLLERALMRYLACLRAPALWFVLVVGCLSKMNESLKSGKSIESSG
jgi:hypothetical protein